MRIIFEYFHFKSSFQDLSAPNKGSDRSVYVFFNLKTRLTKIGISYDVKRRMCNIQTASGCELKILYTFKPVSQTVMTAEQIERFLMKYFKAKQTFGEWFKLDHTDRDCVARLFEHINSEDGFKRSVFKEFILPQDNITLDRISKSMATKRGEPADENLLLNLVLPN